MLNEQSIRERECIHRARGAAGDFYSGVIYIEHLQRLQSFDALRFAGNVTPFFWSDAAQVVVWLCDNCAEFLHLRQYRAVAG